MKLCDTRFRFSSRGWAMIDFTSDAAAILTRAPLLPKVRRRSHGSAYLRRLRRGHLPEVRHPTRSGERIGHGIISSLAGIDLCLSVTQNTHDAPFSSRATKRVRSVRLSSRPNTSSLEFFASRKNSCAIFCPNVNSESVRREIEARIKPGCEKVSTSVDLPLAEDVKS